MKKIKFIILFFIFLFTSKSISQTDCVDAIIICGDANLSGLVTEGIGTQEISSFNACASGENNSIWLKIKFKTGGTFGFLITPETTDLVIDFDFWIFGPTASCSNLGTAIRCSTTNPLQASQLDNLTGMNETETDVSEGPGSDGNSFIQWMNVLPNQVYYIAIDRPRGFGNFSIAWTGTATFYTPPVAELPNDLVNCDNTTNPSAAFFDLTANSSITIGNQTNLIATYFTNYSDAFTNTLPIQNPSSFQNTINPEKIFIRITNTITGCFDVTDFNINVAREDFPITDFTYTTPICIEGENPIPILANNFTNVGHFLASPEGLSINSKTGFVDLLYSKTGNYTIKYSITNDDTNCYFPQESTYHLEINDCMVQKGISPNNDKKNDFFNLEKFDVKELKIFNRYGVAVYTKTNYSNQWYGQSDKGKELPDGTYYFIINLKNGREKTGWIYINREK